MALAVPSNYVTPARIDMASIGGSISTISIDDGAPRIPRRGCCPMLCESLITSGEKYKVFIACIVVALILIFLLVPNKFNLFYNPDDDKDHV